MTTRKQTTTEVFTPGPYRIVWKSQAIRMVHIFGGEPGDNIAVAHVFGVDEQNEKANAHLIAAAPELYENLRDMVKVWENGWKVDRDIYLHHAKAALAAAEGRAP